MNKETKQIKMNKNKLTKDLIEILEKHGLEIESINVFEVINSINISYDEIKEEKE